MIQRKQYKADLPQNTIQRIREILNDADLFVEIIQSISNFDFHSCRLQICDEELAALNIGTNGKGLTKKYSMASAYAEFMERLQNRFLFIYDYFQYASKQYIASNKIDPVFSKFIKEGVLELDYYHSADEKIKLYEDLNMEERYFIENLFRGKDFSTIISDEIIYAPFFNVSGNTVSYLPIKWLYLCSGSNGMCAGNTATEAIIQGVCEVFERFAMLRIFQQKIVPPNIPVDFFKGHHIYDLILEMQKKRYKIIIKDCSLGMGLPIIGITVIDYETGKYAFHLGSDICPITALERCFTELFQGGEKIRFNYIHQFHKDRYDIEKNFFSHLYNGMGFLPEHIFSDQYSYEFNPTYFQHSTSDKEDINYLSKLISNLGHSLYVRDVSFLGFPSYYVYIHGMSEVIASISINSLKYYLLFKNKIHIFWNIPNATNTEIKEFSLVFKEYIEQNKASSTLDFLKFTLNIAYKYSTDYFMSLLFLLCDDYENSIKYLDQYILNDIDKLDNLYFACLKDALNYKNQSLSDEVIRANLSQIYPVETIEEVLNGLERNSLLENHEFTTCFNCSECRILSHCAYFKVLSLVKKLQVLEEKNPINQENLREVFSSS